MRKSELEYNLIKVREGSPKRFPASHNKTTKEGDVIECVICGRSDIDTRVIKSKDGKYYCRKHYLQIYRRGHTYETIYDKNEIKIYDGYAEIVLKNKHGIEVGRAKIDIDDVEKAKHYKWHLRKAPRTSYVATTLKGGEKLFLHRFVIDYNGDLDVDHIDHDGLNNQKENLRIVTHSLNLINQHNEDNGVKKTPSNRYSATIMLQGKSIYLGTFDTYQEAKDIRMQYENKLYSNI